jgi:hypothetical protein
MNLTFVTNITLLIIKLVNKVFPANFRLRRFMDVQFSKWINFNRLIGERIFLHAGKKVSSNQMIRR